MLGIDTPVSSPLISIRLAEIWHHGSSPGNETVQWSESQLVPITSLLPLAFPRLTEPIVIHSFLIYALLFCSLLLEIGNFNFGSLSIWNSEANFRRINFFLVSTKNDISDFTWHKMSLNLLFFVEPVSLHEVNQSSLWENLLLTVSLELSFSLSLNPYIHTS